jgi:hypothetical protein
MLILLSFYAVAAVVALVFVADAAIQLRRINGFSEFLTGYLAGVSKRAQEAIKAGDFEWERFYNLDISASFDALDPLSFRRYSSDWPSFLVIKPSV